MIKVIIADDEYTVHEQLSMIVPWDELGWKIVGHAYNGEQARQLTLEHRPDLILTDIKMPIMGGLDYMSWLKQSDCNAKIIVLSGYREFDFSRSAFLLGACDYMLKPVNAAELLLVLSRVAEDIHLESRSKEERINERAVLNQGLMLIRDEFFTELIDAPDLEENEIIVRAAQLLITLPEAGYSVALLHFIDLDESVYERFDGDRSLFDFAARNVMHESLGSSFTINRNRHRGGEYVLLYTGRDLNGKKLAASLEQLEQTLLRCVKAKTVIGVSGRKQRLSKLSVAYAEAKNAMEGLRLEADAGRIAFYLAQEPPSPDGIGLTEEWRDLLLLIDVLLQTGTLREGDRLPGRLTAFLHNTAAKLSLAEWKKKADLLLDKLEKKAEGEETLPHIHEARIGVQELRVRQVNALLNRMFESVLLAVKSDPRTKGGKALVDAIRSYLDAHFETVTLEDTAQRFYIHKNYLCSLFKNVMGQGFMDYVTALRMERAKLLLAEGELKTYEIADQVGYNDPRYFSQIFRKYTGMQPTQYRQAFRDEPTH